MTESEKARIVSLWQGGMSLAQVRQMMAVTPREFDLTIRDMKRNGEFPKMRKTAEEKIVDAYNRGERNTHDIAERYGVGVGYVYTVLKNNKLRLGKKTRNWSHCDRTNDIIADLEDGILSNVEIARKYGVSRQYITKIKRKVEKWNG